MKKTCALMLVAGVLGWCAAASAEQILADSRISAVTVFPDSAMVTRSLRVQVPQGEHRIVLSDIIPDIDQESLRVSSSAADVTLLGAKVEVKYLEAPAAERVKELTEQIQKLKDEESLLRGMVQAVADKKSFLDSVRMFSGTQLPQDLATRTPLAKDLDDILKFLDLKLREHAEAVTDNSVKYRELNKKLEVLNQELAQLGGTAPKLKRSIIVEMQAKKDVSVELNVAYLVRGAAWEPLYDARADFEKSDVELTLNGVIRQRTGEDWQQVDMSLSTAKPAVGGTMPQVEPWFLRPFEPRPMAKAAQLMRFAGTQSYDESEMDSAGLAAPAAAEKAAVREKGVAVVYTLPQKASVTSDGTEHKYRVVAQKLKAEFEYSANPRSVPLAYLGSRVRNAPELQLLAGRVNIFLDGDFVGSSLIGNVGPGEEFDLYLGADENVLVKRQLVEKKVDQTLIAGIPSPNKVTVFKYKLTLENYKSRKIALKLYEGMPVSQDDRIKVKMGKASLEPAVKDWKDLKGVWLWQVGLDPKQKTDIIYSYTIEHPRELAIDGL